MEELNGFETAFDVRNQESVPLQGEEDSGIAETDCLYFALEGSDLFNAIVFEHGDDIIDQIGMDGSNKNKWK